MPDRFIESDSQARREKSIRLICRIYRFKRHQRDVLKLTVAAEAAVPLDKFVCVGGVQGGVVFGFHGT